MTKTWFKLSFPDALRLIEMVSVLKMLKVLTFSLGSSFIYCRLSAIRHTSLMVPSFLSLENPLSDSYTFMRTLTWLTNTYVHYSRLLVYDIVKVYL